MAKIFWIAEREDDTMKVFAFNNKRKAEEKATGLAPHFSFGDHGVPKEEGNDYGDEWLYSGTIDAKECFLLYREDGMPGAKGFDSEDAAKEWVDDSDGAGACFPVKLKGGMSDVYMSTEVEASGKLWTFSDSEIYEASKATMKTLKHVKLFEAFVASKK